jgi:hypothetical protein
MATRHPGPLYGSSLKVYTDEERAAAERIAGGKRYPDRALTRGKVRRLRRQREALERAADRAAAADYSTMAQVNA